MPVTPADFRNARILTGPTGSGKSEFALGMAEQWNAEIISMDSMTLYRRMDIGTAKPTADERRRVPHHLVDVLDPWESATVAWWLDRAAACVRDIEARGKIALFVGGTPLYLKALLCGLFEGPAADADLRHRLLLVAQQQGGTELHRRLASVDPPTAQRLHPNDIRRLIRALEVFELTGRPISDWQQQWRDESKADTPLCWWLDWPRDQLFERINHRVQRMIDAGWVDEVRRLQKLPQPLSREARQALGYREIEEFLAGKRSLAETVALIQTKTRQFAKRQITWFRSLPGCRRLSPGEDPVSQNPRVEPHTKARLCEPE